MKTETGTLTRNALLLAFDDTESGTESLSDLVELVEYVDQAIRYQVRALRNRGLTWEQIGDALGVTRQAAQKRFAHSS